MKTPLLLLVVWLLAPGVRADAAAASGQETAASLAGSQWRWVRTQKSDDSVLEPGSDRSRPYTLAFGHEGRLTIRADCNQLLGTWEQNGSYVALRTTGPTTLMACPEDSLARAFVADLGAAVLHFFRDGDLYLDLRYDTGTMRLSPLSRELPGTRWRVTRYHDGEQGVVGVLPGSELTATFEAGGQLVGHAGCNRFRAPYEAEGERLSVGPPAVTRMHCAEPPGVMEQERRFLVALQQAASRSFDGEQLDLRTANGALAVTLVAD